MRAHMVVIDPVECRLVAKLDVDRSDVVTFEDPEKVLGLAVHFVSTKEHEKPIQFDVTLYCYPEEGSNPVCLQVREGKIKLPDGKRDCIVSAVRDLRAWLDGEGPLTGMGGV